MQDSQGSKGKEDAIFGPLKFSAAYTQKSSDQEVDWLFYLSEKDNTALHFIPTHKDELAHSLQLFRKACWINPALRREIKTLRIPFKPKKPEAKIPAELVITFGENNSVSATLHVDTRTMSQSQAHWQFKGAIMKALQTISSKAQLNIARTAKPIDPSDLATVDLEENAPETICFPYPLSSYDLKTLTQHYFFANKSEDKTKPCTDLLKFIHNQYKRLKIQRLHARRGNHYQHVITKDSLKISSKQFLTDLHIYLEDNQPRFYGLRKKLGEKIGFITDTIQRYDTALNYLEVKRHEWIQKKIAQEKKPKASVEIRLLKSLPDISNYHENVNIFCTTLKTKFNAKPIFVEAEKESRVENAIDILAHHYALTRSR